MEAEGVMRISDATPPADAVEIGVRPEDVKVRPWSDDAVGRSAQAYEVEALSAATRLSPLTPETPAFGPRARAVDD
jgi:hypothetical protein